ncbi:hypothetical protein FNF31_07290 [Cafeteria roenbergensis]|uniref:Uncharacterized protein n=1 Tax=Cafeteria roenbergensis TaxID=33653 RepID=A0A5A8C8X3_CAFRO|nr:hypothetical protein FNF31_07290 [Cafeteria roenbergensis]
MDPDIGAEPAGWTAFGVFSTLTVVAAARMIIHLPTGRQSVCGAALGFHAVLLLWTLALTVSSALFVLPWNTSFDNLLLDNAANCFSLTLYLFVDAHWRGLLHPAQSRQRRQLTCVFVAANLALYSLSAALVIWEYIDTAPL